eukprot:7808872-Heterocapsa_arctica.AAC.1
MYSDNSDFGLLSYPLPPMIGAHPHFASNPNLRVYATFALLQLQVADSSPLDGSVPTPVGILQPVKVSLTAWSGGPDDEPCNSSGARTPAGGSDPRFPAARAAVGTTSRAGQALRH